METGADGLSVAEVAEHSTMDCARRSADHLMDPHCTFDGGLLEGGLLEGVHLFFAHIEELDFGWRKDMEVCTHSDMATCESAVLFIVAPTPSTGPLP